MDVFLRQYLPNGIRLSGFSKHDPNEVTYEQSKRS